jgi:hypothetical protein
MGQNDQPQTVGSFFDVFPSEKCPALFWVHFSHEKPELFWGPKTQKHPNLWS